MFRLCACGHCWSIGHLQMVILLPAHRMDRYTRWPETIPISSITAEREAAHTFLQGWISRFGVPSTIIVTDRGRQFESELWRHLS